MSIFQAFDQYKYWNMYEYNMDIQQKTYHQLSIHILPIIQSCQYIFRQMQYMTETKLIQTSLMYDQKYIRDTVSIVFMNQVDAANINRANKKQLHQFRLNPSFCSY